MEVKAIKKCILVLAANPRSTDRLELEREAAKIERQLQQKNRRDYVVRIEQGNSIKDLSRYLLKYQPVIVHVVGHGSATGKILLETDLHPATPAEIANLFATVQQQIECVILNSCFSDEMADALVEYIPCTIGIDEEIDDSAAVTFISKFYEGVASNIGYYKAFELGRDQIKSSELLDDNLPCLITRDRTLLGVPEDPYGNPNETLTVVTRSGKSASTTQPQEKPTLYPLWYGTNRRRDSSKVFSEERDNCIHYGRCEVIVPKSHKIGSPGFLEQFLRGKSNRLKLDKTSLKQMIAEDFWTDVKANLAKKNPGERIAVVFIHGFNVSFEGAALTAAQLGCDLKIPLTAFYSWPSQGKPKLREYTADEASIQASEPYIVEFLTRFVTETDADRVHIIAHSMGNRGLLRSLQRIATQFQGQSTVPFGQIFLAAPDEDRDVFRDLTAVCPTVAERTTVYISRNDQALRSSGWIHKRSRTGFSPPVTIVPGVDTIDVSNIDLTILGHGYFSDDESVLSDMYSLLSENKSPQNRFRLIEQELETQKYWMMK